MTKACYVGIGGKARKVKKIYTGVNNVARKVKKGYVGVGGVARPFFSAEQKLSYYGEVTSLPSIADKFAAALAGEYAVFAGGDSVDGKYDAVSAVATAYSRSLVRSVPNKLSVARKSLAAASVGGYAVFAGGRNAAEYSGRTDYATVDAYNASLTRTTPTGLSVARSGMGAASVGGYALFGGGVVLTSQWQYKYYSTVDAYNASLTRTTPTGLSVARSGMGATSVGGYALFGGGVVETLDLMGNNSIKNFATVDVYTEYLTKSTGQSLPSARYYLAAAAIGDYALFAGGSFYNGSVTSEQNNVYAYKIT